MGWLRPYAAKAKVEHEFDTDHLNIFVTFRFAMETTSDPLAEPVVHDVMPPLNLWLVEADDIPKPVTVSAWQDAWTLLLTVPEIDVLPNRVTLAYGYSLVDDEYVYEGPNENLRITWDKQWEPWGPIVSVELPPVYTTRTFSTGPAQQDDVDVSNVNILFIDCSANDITIGGFVGGVNGQVLHIARLCAAVNDVTLEHNEGTPNQNIFLHRGQDETLGGEYGGWVLACNGENWYDLSHAKHID